MFKIKFRRKFKQLFMQWNLHVLFNPFVKLWLLLSYMTKMSKWRKAHKDLPYNDFPVSSIKGERRYGLYEHVSKKVIGDAPINYLEFGVAAGRSFTWWIENQNHLDSRFIGFDTFTGLPEDWGPFKKGHFAQSEMPKIDDARSQFEQGLFQQTLLPFIQKQDADFWKKRTVVHLDADLYSATIFVLTILYPYLKKGDILLFDEFNVPLSEFRAFEDFVASFYIDYEVLGATNNYFQVAIMIK